ncbi:hypothetical protein BDW42DRAFT_111690 [Aspergillus taichungensis]|uniref:Uncharacterized protein n=1 Tax=Aspergillus taichungensis TaxID=482145 RepID=A0A2J5HTG4_9EURO|nr:hypothetical protein BDW42DRAFT_111690 [Aspergillus taichungensis]
MRSFIFIVLNPTACYYIDLSQPCEPDRRYWIPFMLSCRNRHHLITSHSVFHRAATAFSSFLTWPVVAGWFLSLIFFPLTSPSLPHVWYVDTMHRSSFLL